MVFLLLGILRPLIQDHSTLKFINPCHNHKKLALPNLRYMSPLLPLQTLQQLIMLLTSWTFNSLSTKCKTECIQDMSLGRYKVYLKRPLASWSSLMKPRTSVLLLSIVTKLTYLSTMTTSRRLMWPKKFCWELNTIMCSTSPSLLWPTMVNTTLVKKLLICNY